jgi:hypothetical protein
VIAGYYRGCSDAVTAAGFETAMATQMRRRNRGASLLAHHLRFSESDLQSLLRDPLQEQGLQHQMLAPELSMVRRRGRRLTDRNRVATFLLMAVVIAVRVAFFRTASHEIPAVAGPEPVAGPHTSADWFGPLRSRRSDFVALNASGASRFVSSSDGVEWFESATWNSPGGGLTDRSHRVHPHT